MNILFAAATVQEITPLLQALGRFSIDKNKGLYHKNGHTITICVTGIGCQAACYTLTKELCSNPFDLAIQAGIAGSFSPEAPIGSLWKIKNEMLADLGAENKDGTFMDLFEMGLLDKNLFPFKEKKLPAPTLSFPLLIDIPEANAITVNSVSGVEATISKRMGKYDPLLESMEGAAFHYVCLMENIPFVQLRSVSNRVAIRDKTQWNIPLAIAALNKALMQIPDQLPLP